jgi:hypothetical protein
MTSLVVYIDVDDTIVRSYGTKRIPILKTINHIKDLFDQGAVLYCWSSGGAEYARKSAEEFGIDHCFTSYLPKPHVILDDQLVSDWRLCLEIHPSSIKHNDPIQYFDEINGVASPGTSLKINP